MGFCFHQISVILTSGSGRLGIREEHDARLAILDEVLERRDAAVVGLDLAAEALERDGLADGGLAGLVCLGFGLLRVLAAAAEGPLEGGRRFLDGGLGVALLRGGGWGGLAVDGFALAAEFDRHDA